MDIHDGIFAKQTRPRFCWNSVEHATKLDAWNLINRNERLVRRLINSQKTFSLVTGASARLGPRIHRAERERGAGSPTRKLVPA